MFWIIQKNLFNEKKYLDMANILAHGKINHMCVKPVPFTNRLVPEDFDTSKALLDLDQIEEPLVKTDEPIYVSGTYTLAKIAKDRGWSPGSFLKNLSYDVWSKAWPSDILLNPNARTSKIKDAEIQKTSFVRPVEDSKSFAGTVFSVTNFRSWKEPITKMSHDDPLHGDVEIIISDPVEIYTETRFFIVDNKVSTYSEYKRGGKVIYSPNVDSDVVSFAESCIAEWVPDRAFVLDIALTPNGFKIIEVNNINSSGFYDCDISKLVDSIENLGRKYYE